MKEDANLAEVKAVLKRIQQFDGESGGKSPVSLHDAKARTETAKSASALSVFDTKLAAVMDVASKSETRLSRRWSLALIATVVMFCVGIAVFIMLDGTQVVKNALAPIETSGQRPATTVATPATPGASATKQSPSQIELLTEARRLLTSGDVLGARQRLLSSPVAETPAIVFILAQSYDPNYLLTLAQSNASGDRGEAERWYRRWYSLASASGLEMDPDRLKRIINAMN